MTSPISFVDNFCEIDDVAPAAPAATALATLKDTALAPLRAIEQDLRALSERYRDVAFDMTTPKGLAAAKAARQDLRENGRYLVQRAVQRCKDEANAAKKAVDAEAERLISLTAVREAEINAAIAGRERELADEKAERERIESERVAKHRANLDTIRGYVSQADGKTAAQISAAVDRIVALRAAYTPDGFKAYWEEFAAEAEAEWQRVIEELRALRVATQAKEAEAQRLEAQRLENARVAAELAERQRQLDAQAAAIKRQADELAAARAESDRLERLADERRAALKLAAQNATAAAPAPDAGKGTAVTPEPSKPEAAPNTPALDSQHVLKAEAARPDATDRETPATRSPVGGPMGAEQPAATGLVPGTHKRVITVDLDTTHVVDLPPPIAPPTLRLGAIVQRLGFTVTAEFLTSLGFAPAGSAGAAKLYHEHQFAALCAALAEHVLKVGEAPRV